VIVDISIGKMVQRTLQTPNLSVDDNPFVGIQPTPGSAITPKYPDVVVRIPSAPPPPPAEIMDEPRNRESSKTFSVTVQGIQDLLL